MGLPSYWLTRYEGLARTAVLGFISFYIVFGTWFDAWNRKLIEADCVYFLLSCAGSSRHIEWIDRVTIH